jgi:ATP-dependent DNA ligase
MKLKWNSRENSCCSLIQPGTVLDGEVVMHRGTAQHKARPVFIVFDVLTLGPTSAVLHLPFEQRLHHLRQASFRNSGAQKLCLSHPFG